jgi:acyl-CoA hydrolase
MITDGMLNLVEAGAVTNARKTLHPGKIIGTFAGGSERLYRWLDNNPMIECHPVHYTNDPYIIAKNCKQISINGTIEVDITGQACSESIGPRQYSGVGGQMDFIRGAAMSPGGKAFLVLNSTAQTKQGTVSTIVPMLKQGAFVTTSRNDIDYVVTEYGIAHLRGKSVRQRAKELIAIAHPTIGSL